jgi:hypothetical protein
MHSASPSFTQRCATGHPRPRPRHRLDQQQAQPGTALGIDGKQHIATGCLTDQIGEAERCLAESVSSKYRPARHTRDIAQIDIADVLSIYLDDCGARVVDQPKLERCVARLNNYWGGKMLSEITYEECRVYVRSRGKIGGARSELETLRAAINRHAKQNLHRETIHVSLPAKGQPARSLANAYRSREATLGLLVLP